MQELDALGQDIENICKQGYDNNGTIKVYTSGVQQFMQHNLNILFALHTHVTTTTYFSET